MSAKDQIKQIVDHFKREPQIKDKTDGMAEGLMLGAQLADDANELSKQTDASFKALQREYTENGNGSQTTAEISVARDGELVLDDRLKRDFGTVNAQLEQMNWEKAGYDYVDQSISTISGGAIKGKYPTLLALTQFYPEGAIGPFQVEEDGNRYIWDVNKLDWVSIGPYEPAEIGEGDVTTEKLADEAVTLDKVEFKPVTSETQSKNLFNKNKITRGKYVVGTSGVFANNTAYFISQYEKIYPNKVYSRPRPEQLAFYDANKNFISGLSNQAPATFTTPENAAFVVVCDKLVNLETYQLEEGPTATEYQPYGYMVTESLLTDDLKKDLNYKAIDWVESTNLFDSSTVTNGKFISYVNGVMATPTQQPITDWNAGDWREIKPNTLYISRFKDQLAFYDNNKNFISGLPNTRPDYYFITPENAVWVRMTVKTEHLDRQQLNEGDVLLPYEPYGKKIPRSQLGIEESSDENNMITVKELFLKYLLSGGEGVIVGDSNTSGVGTTGYAQDGESIGNSGVLSSPNSHNWANRLVETVSNINPNCELRNWGIAGWSSKNFVNQGISNFIKDTDRIAFVMLGTNDRIKTNSTSIADFEGRLQAIVDHCKILDIPCILMSPIPASVSNDNNTELYAFDTFEVDNAVRRTAIKNNTFYINNYDWFLKYEEENGNMTALYNDELHMTDYGSYDYFFRNVINELGISYKREGVTR